MGDLLDRSICLDQFEYVKTCVESIGFLQANSIIYIKGNSTIAALFSERLLVCAVGLFILLVVFFVFRIQRQRKAAISMKQLIYSTGLEFFIGLMVASICLILLYTLFEPAYEAILQSFYHQGLNQFKELPNFVLSNGTSGIAYSVRSSISFELSSTTLLDLFFVSLIKAVAYIFFCLCLLIICFRLINFAFKKKNVR